MIPFNIPPFLPECESLLLMAARNHKISGDGEFTKRCHTQLELITGAPKALLTTSCTSAIELAALLLDIHPGDEVIMPSFTFVSTANPFVLRGATIVFVDIDPHTMNLNPACVEAAITPRTRAIVPVHYAGVCCDMDALAKIAAEHGLFMVEDAAQALTSTYKGKQAGTLSDIGCLSFHETKNFSMGEGGAVLLNRSDLIERAEIIREKGTNRSRFFRGQVDKYTWVDIGSSYLPSELNAAYLLTQLEQHEHITALRMARWNQYYEGLTPLKEQGRIELMECPEDGTHNAHMFYIKTKDLEERTHLTEWLKQRNILAVFHYIPLHSAEAGQRYGRFHGEDRYTTRESERLLRLPMYHQLTHEECGQVIQAVEEFYQQS
ncbi:MAG: dTDP-4-amino-4,6-dideoxygalactose transaminase [Clostridiales bacterium]|nr:dTDP-4-amino-4,6-dideoxygalactose transaminase [Clostridiales bacterium]